MNKSFNQFKFRYLLPFLVLFLSFCGLKNKSDVVVDSTKQETEEIVTDDPAKRVENEEHSGKTIIQEFDYNIVLDANGFKHILERHSGAYFKDYKPKGTLFYKGTDGNGIISIISKVVQDQKLGFSRNANKVYESIIEWNGKTDMYRLVVSPKKRIITFFRVDKNGEED